ncbi:MAG: hypothetical protein AAF351_01090 [Pseudomonadota bacterium]
MLLRRITQHVKTQNWFAVGIDFVIVVVGVFIGIQVSNWNDARVDYQQQQLIHSRLQADFAIIENDLEHSTLAHEQAVVALETLRVALDRGSVLPEEDAAIKRALRNGYEYWQVSHRSGTFIELLSSGKLELVPDEDLRLALIRYDRRSQQSRFDLEQIRNTLHPDVSKFFRYRTIGRLTRDDRQHVVLSPIVAYDFDTMSEDDEFRRVVDQVFEMQTWIQINMHGQLRRDLHAVLQLLRENQ